MRHLPTTSRADIIDLGNAVEWDHSLNRGLVGWWMATPGMGAGGRLVDLVGRNHGTLTNGPAWMAGSNGFASISFDGVDDAASLGLCPNLELTADMAVMMTFRTTASTGYREWINAAQGGPPYAGWGFGMGPSGSTMGFWPGFAGNDWSNADTNINDGRRHFGGISISGSTATFYLNGRADGSFTPGAARNPSGQVKSLGANVAFGRYSQVVLESVLVYNRALVSGEVSQLYDQSLRGYPDTIRRGFAGSRGSVASSSSRLLNLRRRVYL